MVTEAGGERVQVLNVENHAGTPVYVHAKVCIVDDVWATVGSDNFNPRSWTHDSELSAAVLDTERDPRPTDPGGLGDGARRFARQLRLDLMREHLDMPEHLDRVDAPDDSDLTDPDRAADLVRRSAGPAPLGWMPGTYRAAWAHAHRGRLRRHTANASRPWRRWLTDPAYRTVPDPGGRPLGMKLRRTF